MKTKLLVLSVLAVSGGYYLWVSYLSHEPHASVSNKRVIQGTLPDQALTDHGRASLSADFGLAPDSPDYELAELDKMIAESQSNVASDLPKDQIKQQANSAFSILKSAAARDDKRVLEQIRKLNPNCAWCDDFYRQTRKEFSGDGLSPLEQGFLARVLAQSGRADNARELYQDLKQNVTDPEGSGQPGIAGQALEEANLPTDVVDAISTELSSQNPYVREAAVSILTKQDSLEAAAKLYEHTLERKDPRGYYNSGIGLAYFTPQGESVAYIEALARQQDEYSHLAVKSLLNMGSEGLDRVNQIFGQIDDYALAKRMLHNALDHIKIDDKSLAMVERLSRGASSKAVQEMAQDFLRERKADKDAQHRPIEFNENTEKGFVNPGQLPQAQ